MWKLSQKPYDSAEDIGAVRLLALRTAVNSGGLKDHSELSQSGGTGALPGVRAELLLEAFQTV